MSEKLVVTYIDGSQLKVNGKHKGSAKLYFDTKVTCRSRIKNAYIQRYPLKDHPRDYMINDE